MSYICQMMNCASTPALSCGTFIYVTFFKILPQEIQSESQRETKKEKEDADDKRLVCWNCHLRLIKIFAVMMGLVVMIIMMTFVGHGHGHNHGHNHTNHGHEHGHEHGHKLNH